MKYLLDTDVISELISKNAETRVLEWIDGIDPENVFLSSITIGELCKGIERLPESMKKTRLSDWLNNDLMLRFNSRILSVDAQVMLTWGKLAAKLEKSGRRISDIDLLILALAAHNNCILVTGNSDDFKGTGIKIINPWAEE
jgi:tRNA(fMet)-specific endonuclease VapC